MAKRKIIKIVEKKCNGCGACVPNCPEGAIQIIDGKARLISDIFCDGLGACIGNCPQDAIEIIEREAEQYDEKKTMRENIIKAGEKTIIAHLKHLNDHGETKYFKQAVEVLKEERIEIDLNKEICDKKKDKLPCGCLGSKVMDFSREHDSGTDESGTRASRLRQWPVQLHLVPPNATYFQGKDVVLSADCVGYSLGDFHNDYLKGRSLSIACPKLDSNTDVYLDKLVSMIDNAKINTLTVMTMEVPCCSGLLSLAKKATENAKRKIPIKSIVVSVKGEILKEEWI
ncbi:MAG: 4Fe-4S ferredoxin [Thermoplasmata archaeon M9B1D]|nr:MAG: 4Fe-4S ferredoxin [Thermoplasmata archaeon M9B1D]PNX51085.1 MAG: 4Fe-4S ferredoxin [Thermoplasmata archaeon M8B2D]